MATSDIVRLFLVSVVWPAMAAGAIWGIGYWQCRSKTRETCKAAAWPNACGIASSFGVAYLGLQGMATWPPTESRSWLFYWLVIAVLLACVLSWRRLAPAVVWPMKGLLAAAALFCLLRATIQYQWNAAETGIWLLGLTTLMLGFGQGLASASRRSSTPFERWLFLGGLLLSAGASTISLGAAGSVKLAQHCAALGTCLAVFGLYHYAGWSIGLHVGGLIPFTLIYLGLLLNGVFYSELPRLSAILLLCCPLAVWVLRLSCLSGRSWLARLACMATISLALGGWAIWLAIASREPLEYAY